MKKWQIIKSTDISPSEWFPLLRQKVRLADGKIVKDYFVSPMGNAVMVLPVTSKKEIVLVKQYRHGLGKILLELPAGFQQKGKTLKESAVSELEEETGIKTSPKNLVFLGKFANHPAKTLHVTHCYLAKNLEFNSRQKLDAVEDVEVIKVSPKELLKMTKNGKIWVADSVAAITRAFFKYPKLFMV